MLHDGTTTLTSFGIAAAATVMPAAAAETQADAALGDVAGEGLGNIAAAMSALKARQAVAYSHQLTC